MVVSSSRSGGAILVPQTRGLLQTQPKRCRLSFNGHKRDPERMPVVCMARKKVSRSQSTPQNDTNVPFNLDLTNPLIKKSVTVYIPALICVLILMYIDAAYSGDWSRIGLITPSQEEFLRQFAIISVGIHGALGIGAAAISKRRGEKTYLTRGLKTFIVGIVAFSEVLYLTEDQL